MPLIPLESGDWVDPEHVVAIRAVPRQGAGAMCEAQRDRVVVELDNGSCAVVWARDDADARSIRARVARQVAEATARRGGAA